MMKRALLIGIEHAEDVPNEAEVLLEELAELVQTLGCHVVHKELVRIRKHTSDFLMGFGKANTISELAKAHECDILIFDNELSPAQQRNWEKLTKLTVIDRQEVILDIFAKRAHTKEAILQVELARQEYFLPRLKRAWTHLSRQRGGGAMQRNEGETQLEADRRMIRTRIVRLKSELEEVVKHRDIQRQRRVKLHMPSAAIIGYTNAGKSSLLNKLTGAEVLTENKLFATLDPTTRQLNLKGGQKMLITDTVGFIRNLPHRLVEAFKATLEEAVLSDFLIHVVDASSNDLAHHMQTTLNVMEELGAKDKPNIIVFNKVDLIEGTITLASLKIRFPEACFVSTKTEQGLDNLRKVLEDHLSESFVKVNLLLPHTRYNIIHQLHEAGTILKETFENEGIYISVKLPKEMLPMIESFRQPEK